MNTKLFTLVVMLGLVSTTFAEQLKAKSNVKLFSKSEMTHSAGLGYTFKDSYIRLKYGVNNVYKTGGLYAVYESDLFGSGSDKYSTVILGGNYMINKQWGVFAGVGVSYHRKEIGVTYKHAKYGAVDLGYSLSVGPTLTYVYTFKSKQK